MNYLAHILFFAVQAQLAQLACVGSGNDGELCSLGSCTVRRCSAGECLQVSQLLPNGSPCLGGYCDGSSCQRWHPAIPPIRAQWLFDQRRGNIALDRSGYDSHGVMSEVTLVASPFQGRFAASFNASYQSWIQLPQLTGLTRSIWVQVEAISTGLQSLLTFGHAEKLNLRELRLLNGVPQAFWTDGVQTASLSSTVRVDDGQWHHIALSEHNDLAILSVDGIFWTHSVAHSLLRLQTPVLTIGRRPPSQHPPSYYTGSIDVVTLYTSALNQSDLHRQGT